MLTQISAVAIKRIMSKSAALSFSLSEMVLQAVSRSQSSSTLIGRWCWSAVSERLLCALTVVEVAFRGLTFSIRSSAGWGCSRRKTSWRPSGSWATICEYPSVPTHSCTHTDKHETHPMNPHSRSEAYKLWLRFSLFCKFHLKSDQWRTECVTLCVGQSYAEGAVHWQDKNWSFWEGKNSTISLEV